MGASRLFYCAYLALVAATGTAVQVITGSLLAGQVASAGAVLAATCATIWTNERRAEGSA